MILFLKIFRVVMYLLLIATIIIIAQILFLGNSGSLLNMALTAVIYVLNIVVISMLIKNEER